MARETVGHLRPVLLISAKLMHLRSVFGQLPWGLEILSFPPKFFENFAGAFEWGLHLTLYFWVSSSIQKLCHRISLLLALFIYLVISSNDIFFKLYYLDFAKLWSYHGEQGRHSPSPGISSNGWDWGMRVKDNWNGWAHCCIPSTCQPREAIIIKNTNKIAKYCDSWQVLWEKWRVIGGKQGPGCMLTGIQAFNYTILSIKPEVL